MGVSAAGRLALAEEMAAERFELRMMAVAGGDEVVSIEGEVGAFGPRDQVVDVEIVDAVVAEDPSESAAMTITR